MFQTTSKVEVSYALRIAKALAIAVALLILISKMFFTVSNSEVVAVAYPTGGVAFFTAPRGVQMQWLGAISTFKKREHYDFEEPVQFAEGGKASIVGSIQFEVPLNPVLLSDMYSRYPSPEAVRSGLIETGLQRAVYLTGRMMTSKESFAEKRGDLLHYVEDQLEHGIYRTQTKTIAVADDLDSKSKNVTALTIVTDADGKELRDDKGLFGTYGITTSNFSFRIEYDKKVEEQIQAQQKLAQDINLSIADARKAEQRAITVEKNGQADAAAAKWEQEKVNATLVARAEGEKRAAELNKQKAEFYKQQQILEGEGEAEKRRLIMGADGALDKRLAAIVEINKNYAAAMKDYHGNWVPTYVGGNGSGTANSASALMELWQMKAAKDVSLDISSGKK